MIQLMRRRALRELTVRTMGTLRVKKIAGRSRHREGLVSQDCRQSARGGITRRLIAHTVAGVSIASAAREVNTAIAQLSEPMLIAKFPG